MSGRVVGLDIGRYSVKAVVLNAKFRRWEVVEFAEELVELPVVQAPEANDAETAPVPLEDAPALDTLGRGAMAALDRLRQRGVLTADAVVTALPRDSVYFTQLVLPFSNPAQIADILPPQLDGKLPEEVDDLLLDFSVGGAASQGGFHVLAAATRPAGVAGMLAALGAHAVDPKVVDLSPFPLLTASRALGLGTEGSVAYVDIGWRETGVVIARGDQVQFARVIAGGGETLTEALADTFSLPLPRAREGKHREGFIDAGLPDSASPTGNDGYDAANACRNAVKPIVKRLRNTLQAHLGEAGEGVTSIVIAGSTARLPGLAEYIGQSLGIPCTAFGLEGAPGAAAVAGLAEDGARFATALGLALRAVSGTTGSRFNFRKGPFAYGGNYEFVRAQMVPMAIGIGAIVAATGLWIAGQFVLLRSERATLDEALATVTAEVFGEPVTDPRTITTRLTSIEGGPTLHASRSAFDLFVDAANVLGDLQDQGRELTAKSIDVDFTRFLFRMEGEAQNAETVDELQQELGGVECFGEVTRNDLTAIPGGTGFRFGLQAPIDCDRADAGAVADAASDGTGSSAAARAPGGGRR